MSSKRLKKRESRQAASAKSKAAPPSPRPTLSEQFARLRKEQESSGFAQLDADGHIDERNAPKNYTAAEHVSQLIVDIVVIYISYRVGLSTLEDYFSFEERGWLRTLRLIIGMMWLLWACTHLATVLIGYVSHGVYVRGQSTFVDLTSDISVTAEEGIAKSRRVYPGDLQRQKLHRLELRELRHKAFALGASSNDVGRANGSICRSGGTRAAKADLIELVIRYQGWQEAKELSAEAMERGALWRELEKLGGKSPKPENQKAARKAMAAWKAADDRAE